MKQSLQNDHHDGSQYRNPPHTTADLKQKSSCLHLESETSLSIYWYKTSGNFSENDQRTEFLFIWGPKNWASEARIAHIIHVKYLQWACETILMWSNWKLFENVAKHQKFYLL